MASSRKITLLSSDGESFEVDPLVAESMTIPLPNVNSKILAKVMEYCKKHVESAKAEDRVNDEELKAWDVDFVKVDQATLFDLILAANYLNIKSLLDLTCQTMADMIKGKTPEEMVLSRKIMLRSSDGESFDVEQTFVEESPVLKSAVEFTEDNMIPVPNVKGMILAKVIEYCKKHVLAKVIKYCKKHVESAEAEDRVDEELKAWDIDFVKVDQATLFDLILAANYLDIKSLLDLTCQTVADIIKGQPPEEIRRTFSIRNDFTPEEPEEQRRESQWVFE